MIDNIPLLLFVSYCVGVPVIIFLTGLFGGDDEAAYILAFFWPLIAPFIIVAAICLGFLWCGEAIHKFGRYCHKKLTPKERKERPSANHLQP